MTRTPDEKKPDAPADAPASTDPVVVRRIEGHVVHTLRKEQGVAPPHVEFFSESEPDGFAGELPRFVAFCPDCGAKLTLEQHEDCPFYGGPEVDRDGFVIAVHCGKKDAGGRNA